MGKERKGCHLVCYSGAEVAVVKLVQEACVPVLSEGQWMLQGHWLWCWQLLQEQEVIFSSGALGFGGQDWWLLHVFGED